MKVRLLLILLLGFILNSTALTDRQEEFDDFSSDFTDESDDSDQQKFATDDDANAASNSRQNANKSHKDHHQSTQTSSETEEKSSNKSAKLLDETTNVVRKFRNIIGKINPAQILGEVLSKHNGSLSAVVDKKGEQGPIMKIDIEEDLWSGNGGKSKLKASEYFHKEFNENRTAAASYGVKLALNRPLIPINTNDGQVEIAMKRMNEIGAQLSFESSQDLWRSSDNESFVKANVHYNKQIGQAGTNSQFNKIGAQLRYHGIPAVAQGKISEPVEAKLSVNSEPNKGPSLLMESRGELWSNRNKSASITGRAIYKRTFGKLDGHNYGAHVGLTKDNLNFGVGVTKGLYEAPQVHVELTEDLWKSRDGKDVLSANAYYDKDFGKVPKNHDYGFGFVYSHDLEKF